MVFQILFTKKLINFIIMIRYARVPGVSNLAGARRKSPATSSICAGYFSYSKFYQPVSTKCRLLTADWVQNADQV